MIPVDLIIFLIFIAFVCAAVLRDRKNIKLQGIVIMRRTQSGKAWLYRTAARWPRLWAFLGGAGVIIAIPAMLFISYFLLNNIVQMLSGQVVGAVKLVLPWSGFEDRPGVFLVPWYFWVLGIATVIIPHELFHGITARLAKIRIKSLGMMLLIVLPGAFVDPDERQLQKAKRFAKLRVFAAGSFANFCVGIVCLFIGMLITASLFTQVGIMPLGVINNTPAANANISGALLAINGTLINSQDDFSSAMQKIPVNSTIVIETTKGNYTITTVKHPELNQSYLGLAGPYNPNYVPNPDVAAAGMSGVASFFVTLFNWLFMINIGIGLFNLLPIKPLDGGLVFETIVSRFVNKENTRRIVKAVSIIMVLVVIYSILGPVIMG